MHPLKTYLRNLRIAAKDPQDFQRSLDSLAEATETTTGVLQRLHYPRQSKLSPAKALRLELATNGQVPASTVCEDTDNIISLVDRVLKMRENNRAAGV